MKGTLAFVPPRYGPTVVGGAERVIATTARGFASRGWNVEVLTTCATDHYTWANDHPAGDETDGQLTIRRFPTVVNQPARDRARIFEQILSGQDVAIQDQQLWMNDGFRCPELWHYLLDNSNRYRAIVLAPYMFWTTFACGQIDPQKTILMPCLHDEPTAYLDLFQPLISGAAGLWFLSEPERELADRIFHVPSHNAVVGAGVNVPDEYHPERFCTEFGIDGPFAFYAGRRERGKGWDELRNAFSFAVSQGVDLDLVTAGVGDPQIPAELSGRVHDIGFISDAQRNDAMAAAAVYVQPGQMESFSLTVMEAWLAGTPVVANAASDVVTWHIEGADAGLTYRSPLELVECLRFVASQPAAAAALAIPGRSYVLDNYGVDLVLERMEATVVSWLPEVEAEAVR
ncbi:MAG: glycosyltransferase family 4 protein [Acidimicrobiales bacterium]